MENPKDYQALAAASPVVPPVTATTIAEKLIEFNTALLDAGVDTEIVGQLVLAYADHLFDHEYRGKDKDKKK